MSELYQSLSHSKWDCKYHVVFVPKRRRKVIFGKTRPSALVFQNATIRFSPTAAGVQTGNITLASNDPARPSVTQLMSGSGAGTTTGTSTKACEE